MENLILFVFIDACAVYNNCYPDLVKVLGLNVQIYTLMRLDPFSPSFFYIKNLPVSGNILDLLYSKCKYKYERPSANESILVESHLCRDSYI